MKGKSTYEVWLISSGAEMKVYHALNRYICHRERPHPPKHVTAR